MTDPTNYKLKHKPFVILGLLAESPQGDHPYNIYKKIEERGMKNWTNIGLSLSLSTIYRTLNRLETENLVESYTEEVDGRERKVFSLKDLGWKILYNKVFTVLNEYHGTNDKNFYVAYSMFPYLKKQDRVEVFSNSLSIIKKHKKDLEDMLINNETFPMNVVGLFKHPMMILQTDIEFLEWVLDKIEKGEDEFGPEAYGE